MKRLLQRVLQRPGATALILGISLLSGVANATGAENNVIKNPGFGFKYKKIVKAMPYDEVIKQVSTPKQAAFYRDKCINYRNDLKNYGEKDYWASFKQVHERGKDDCDGIAYAMAALLEDDGYTPQVLWLKTVFSQHLVFPYQDPKTGKWGCIGVAKVEDRYPRFNTIEEMVKTLKVGDLYPYQIDDRVYPHGLQNLDTTYTDVAWNNSDGNLKTKYLANVSDTARHLASAVSTGRYNSSQEGNE